jgi:hypothetical protein
MLTDMLGLPKCEKCGAATKLLSFIPRFGERPTYQILSVPPVGRLHELHKPSLVLSRKSKTA